MAVATALCLVVALPAFAAAAGPDYRADITPATVPAGTDQDPTLVVTLTHLATTAREMGSVRIRPPAGITLTGATAKRGSNVLNVAVVAGAVTVGNLQLNNDHETATVTIKADIPCGVSGDRTWKVEAIKNQSFDDAATLLVQDEDSNLTTQVERCSLKFITQPAAAAVDTKITSVAANPAGTPLRVQLLDGAGNPARQAGIVVDLVVAAGPGDDGDLHGVHNVPTTSNGIAEFGPKIGQPGLAYQLQATYSSSAIADSSRSAEFDITDVAIACSGNCPGGTIREGDTAAVVTAVSNGVLSYTLGLDNLDCDNAVNRSYHSESEVLTFNVTSATGRTVVTITLKASSVDRAARKYEVCFSSPESDFTNLYGAHIAPGQAGLLAACPKKVAVDADPCVKSKTRANNGDVVVTFSVPGGDPRGKI